MKKYIMVCLLVVMFFLTACETNEIGCSDGLRLVDGVCVLESTLDDNPQVDEEENQEKNEDEELVVPDTCNVELSSYQGNDFSLVYADEFDYEGTLDSTMWEYQIGNGGAYGIPGWGNNEAQYYSDDLKNVEVKDGLLRITATTEGYAQYGYTSGRIRTMGLADFEYGIVEVCAKMPTTLGTWPAIWMLPTNSPYGGWPYGGEIDIMEAVGFETDTIHFNIHTENDNWGTSRSIGSHTSISDIDSEFHAYAIKWTQTSITFYVDGVSYFRYTPVQYSKEYWPFDSEFHLILNIAVGGAWGGIQGIQNGDWEDSMFVDYVRVYQEEQGE